MAARLLAARVVLALGALACAALLYWPPQRLAADQGRYTGHSARPYYNPAGMGMDAGIPLEVIDTPLLAVELAGVVAVSVLLARALK